MSNERHPGSKDAGSDVGTQGPAPHESEHLAGLHEDKRTLGLTPASSGSERPQNSGDESTRQPRGGGAELEALRAAVSNLEREVAMIRADLERLRQESERAGGSKLP